jgi:hypothetical protein
VTRAWVKKLPSPKDDPATLAAAVKTRLAIIIILFIDGEKNDGFMAIADEKNCSQNVLL